MTDTRYDSDNEDFEELPDIEDFGKCMFCGCMTLKGESVCMECDSQLTEEYRQSCIEDMKGSMI